MSNLRERIAAVIQRDNPAYTLAGADVLAQSIIEELRMHEEHGRLRVTRYVTDWQIDE